MDRVSSYVKRGNGGASDATADGGPPSLSISNNSTKEPYEGVNKLQGMHKRVASALVHEIRGLARVYGVERLGFLTLTFGDHVTDIHEAQRRFNSLNTHVIKSRYERAICVVERSKSRRIHFHLVVVLPGDIRTGFDFQAIQRQDYRSANALLRSEWAFWRKTAPAYRFGRTELLPVKSCADGIAFYVGKYIAKHVRQRSADDKGARLVRYIGFKAGDRKASAVFGWVSPHAKLWRLKCRVMAAELGIESGDDMARLFGPHWAYKLQGAIIAQDVVSRQELAQIVAERQSYDEFRRWSHNVGGYVNLAAKADRESPGWQRKAVPPRQMGPDGRLVYVLRPLWRYGLPAPECCVARPEH